MKSLKVTTLVLISTMLLAGCTQQTSTENNEDKEVAATSETAESTEQTSTETEQSSSISSEAMEESTEETEAASTEEETAETSTDESQNSDAENDVADFEEGDILQDTIDLEGLTMETATDNPNKRVLLFSNDEGQKEYKSVFIKRTNRLKIIDTANDDLLLNEELDI
ncbi:hypothetical protein KV134_08010 [Tetragenococcus halophilus]|uniref:DUF3642 domain-containing protein n=1 Tax=Tetragenococcus halophilus subsp. halophilus TaxID=1513897 RepID=A0A2H6CNE8_TETHA|nr:hypothetical protein [Tetragenococcus halophilus]MCO7027079.1 hypothetical protein [Tetragenococcus halophilus]MCO8284643.1 hypothetical protein [Tetragenococcus halophilus]MCO8286079.1 hypothetical protein [Tetragenococcus halophilus]MCO8293175.1 hypothetical protein [Tetragenococcus halophilus]QXN86166.1 hypothetical protein KV134_08010 [Tetragenococcus halophilus]